MKPANMPVADVRRMYLRELQSADAIAAHFGCSTVAISRYLAENDIPIRTRADNFRIARNTGVSRTKYDENEVCRLYIEDKLSETAIALKLGCTAYAVHRILKRRGITLRSRSDSMNILQKQMRIQLDPDSKKRVSYRVNEAFFKTWTPKMAWVLGLLYSDGHIEKGLNAFCLTLKDIDVLHNVRELMGFTGEVKALNDTDARRLTVCRRPMVEDLRVLGLFPAKSLTVQWPEAMPRDMVRHFLRGCWDGDGCFAATKYSLVSSIVSGSKAFALETWAMLNLELESFRSEKFKCTIAVVPASVRNRDGKTWPERERYTISFGGHEAVQEFVEYLYKDVDLTQSMMRKRMTAERFFDMRDYRAQNPWRLGQQQGAHASVST